MADFTSIVLRWLVFTLAVVAPPFVPTGKIPNFAKTFSDLVNARLAT